MSEMLDKCRLYLLSWVKFLRSAVPVDASEPLVLAGNDATYGIQLELMRLFMLDHPGVTLQYVGGGGNVGVDHQVEGKAEVASPSYPEPT